MWVIHTTLASGYVEVVSFCRYEDIYSDFELILISWPSSFYFWIIVCYNVGGTCTQHRLLCRSNTVWGTSLCVYLFYITWLVLIYGFMSLSLVLLQLPQELWKVYSRVSAHVFSTCACFAPYFIFDKRLHLYRIILKLELLFFSFSVCCF